MQTTIVVQIGNSDNKLSQAEWSVFCESVNDTIRETGFTVHFHGHSPSDAPWQNAAWVIEGKSQTVREVWAQELRKLAAKFRQESIAVTVGETKFLKP